MSVADIGRVLIPLLALLLAPGCARRVPAQKPAAATKGAVPLPSWAPQDPSPEFLRAARVLKPIPPEANQEQAGDDPAAQAWYARYRLTYVAGYEFFGTLSARQMERFFADRKLLLRVPSLPEEQRAALDRWIEVRRESLEGVDSRNRDFLVTLYKLGAREDLSNVEVGFKANGRAVHVLFCVTRSDGTRDDNGICAHFAFM